MSALGSVVALTLAAAAQPASVAEGPVAPAGAQLSPLARDGAPAWRFALATGVAGRFGGRQASATEDDHSVLLHFGGQADGAWAEGHGQAVRLRFRLFTGRESSIYVPSDGEVELAYMIGRPEFRFVVGRVEVARYPGLAIQALAQAGTLPCFDGTVSLAGDTMELSYFISPVELAWVRYTDRDHITHVPGWESEDDHPSAASAARLRHSVFLEGGFVASAQVDFVKLWSNADMLFGLEGTVGYQLHRQSASVHAGVRVQVYTRRGVEKDTSTSSAEELVFAAASLAF